ncbi:MAG: T9SS type A sorting domain-containing protein, partial [Saprospiraceae bacterium]
SHRLGGLSGKFRVGISAGGYENQIGEIRLESGGSLNRAFFLEPTTVGVFDLLPHLPTLAISPNPFTEFTVLDLADFEQGTYLRIFNSVGQLVRSESVIGGQFYILDRENLDAGAYIFTLFDNNNELLGNGKVLVK